jgi:hypothetical protein
MQKRRKQYPPPSIGVVGMVAVHKAVYYPKLLQGKHKPQYRNKGKTYCNTLPEIHPIHRHVPKKMILLNQTNKNSPYFIFLNCKALKATHINNVPA